MAMVFRVDAVDDDRWSSMVGELFIGGAQLVADDSEELVAREVKWKWCDQVSGGGNVVR